MSGRYKTLQTTIELPGGERWLQREAVKNSTSNAKQKRIALEQFDKFLVQNKLSLETVDNDVLEYFSIWLDDELGLAHSTLPHRWYAVRTYLNDEIEEGLGYLDNSDDWILQWVDKGTKTDKELDSDVHWLPIEKIEALIDGAKNLKNEMVIRLLWHTGCRPSEIARMKHRRVNRDTRSIKVRTSKVTDTTAENYERTVFYSRQMRSSMREWLDRGGRAQHPYAAESAHLIVGYNTPSIGPRQVNKIVRMAADEAGIQEDTIERADGVDVNRVTPKTLRHSFAVHSVRGRKQSGAPAMDLERLRRILGHSSLDVTRQYLKYRESDLQDAYVRCFPG